MNKKNYHKYIVYFVLIIVNLIFFSAAYKALNDFEKVPFSAFEEALDKHKIEKIAVVDDGANIMTLKYTTHDDKKFKTNVVANAELINKLSSSSDIELSGNLGISTFECVIIYFLTVIVSGYIANIVFKHKNDAIMRKQLSKDLGIMAPNNYILGNNKDKKTSVGKNVQSDVRLIDVAGCEEEKKEVIEVIDFLKNPKKYSEIGATIPKGVLLVGPPGTGKTLLAKAIAGEAGVHFLYASGSEFIEKYVGVGAQRVRELFKSLQGHRPAVLFIDEIDAIGKQRTGDNGMAEHDQTLNQLLVEMDGINENVGVLIIGATNRPELLDKAFLRKGRFDRKIRINLPDTKGREEILLVHAKKKRISETVSLKEVAQKTHGFSGADLYAVLNEAALLAVRERRKEIMMTDIDEAIDRIMMGHSNKNKKYSEMDKQLVAVHEAGHVVLGLKMNEAAKVDKVTIVPRGGAGGYAMLTPKVDRFLSTEQDLLERISGLLGGRAAEEIVYSKRTSGAANDIEQATEVARAMVTQYGMSRLGIAQLEQVNASYSGHRKTIIKFSENTAKKIDEEVQRILDDCYREAKKILQENMGLLLELAKELTIKETLMADDINQIEKKYLDKKEK